MMDGKVSAVIGTHTRVLTADSKVLPGGTAVICDSGRTGLVCSEGAGILIVEELEHAKKRGAEILFELAGYATNCSGWHVSHSDELQIANCMKNALADAEINVEEVEKAMEEASVEEVSAGMKPLGYLSIVTQVAPMFGLLGTVTGMIGAFDKIGMGQMGSPEKLADNIGEAMITTAAGLIVAIPAMFAYFGFKAHYTANISRISSLLGDLTFHLKEGVRQSKVEQGKIF